MSYLFRIDFCIGFTTFFFQLVWRHLAGNFYTISGSNLTWQHTLSNKPILTYGLQTQKYANRPTIAEAWRRLSALAELNDIHIITGVSEYVGSSHYIYLYCQGHELRITSIQRSSVSAEMHGVYTNTTAITTILSTLNELHSYTGWAS